MSANDPKRAWFVVLKVSIIPLLLGAAIFTLFWFAYEKYGVNYKAHLDKTFFSFLIFFVTFWIFKIMVNLFDWYAVNIAAKTRTELDDKFIPLFKRLAITIIWSIALIMILGRLGINVNALVAALGVGSLAIALAAQDTIANIIAGFLIMVDRPFVIGDDIKLASGERVKVVDIGIRRSKFVSEDRAIIIMPNVELSKSKIINYSARK